MKNLAKKFGRALDEISGEVQACRDALPSQERSGNRASPGDAQIKLQNRNLMRLTDLTLFIHTPTENSP